MSQQTLAAYQDVDEMQAEDTTTVTADGSPYRQAHTGDNRYQHESEGLEQPQDHCQHCGRPVTIRLRRVFGDADDVLHRCSECAAFRELQEGAGANASSHRAWDARAHNQDLDGQTVADGGNTDNGGIER